MKKIEGRRKNETIFEGKKSKRGTKKENKKIK
jgi:hypothetical protein